MRRRDFFRALGGAATWPLHASAASGLQAVGFLNSASAPASNDWLAAFLHGLSEMGYAEGRNVTIEYRWAEGHYDRLPGLAAELVHHHVAVIAATGGKSGLAAKAATSAIPIVFTTGGDPVKEGLVTSINLPGGNATGVNLLVNAVEGKKLGLLRELVPTASLFTVLLNPENPSFATQLSDVKHTAHAIGQQIQVLHASSEREIDAAFATAKRLEAGAMLVGADASFGSRAAQLAALEARYGNPSDFPSA